VVPARKRKCDPDVTSDQSKFQMDNAYLSARQRAIELAKTVDDNCEERGMLRFPSGVKFLNDDRRIPLYWIEVLDLEEQRDAVLTYECRRFYEGKCETHPSSVRVIPDLLVNAHGHYNCIISDCFRLVRAPRCTFFERTSMSYSEFKRCFL